MLASLNSLTSSLPFSSNVSRYEPLRKTQRKGRKYQPVEYGPIWGASDSKYPNEAFYVAGPEYQELQRRRAQARQAPSDQSLAALANYIRDLVNAAPSAEEDKKTHQSALTKKRDAASKKSKK